MHHAFIVPASLRPPQCPWPTASPPPSQSTCAPDRFKLIRIRPKEKRTMNYLDQLFYWISFFEGPDPEWFTRRPHFWGAISKVFCTLRIPHRNLVMIMFHDISHLFYDNWCFECKDTVLPLLNTVQYCRRLQSFVVATSRFQTKIHCNTFRDEERSNWEDCSCSCNVYWLFRIFVREDDLYLLCAAAMTCWMKNQGQSRFFGPIYL